MTTAESVLFNAIAVINLEGDLLDQGEFDAWLELWQHDGLYVVPIDPTETDFKNTLNYACDDHEMRAKRVKLQVSQRFSQELKWAEEDHQIGALEVLGEKLSVALARAVDLITYHAIDPLSGSALDGYTPLVSAAGTKIAEPDPTKMSS